MPTPAETTYRPGLPRALARTPQAAIPMQPPTFGLGGGGPLNAPLPPALDPTGMGGVGGNMGMPSPQPLPPQYDPTMGGAPGSTGMPPTAPTPPDAAGAPPTAPQSDPFDEFVDWQFQRVQQGVQPPEQMGFLETLRSAKNNDPSTFYSILAAFARLDYDGLQRIAAEGRQRRSLEQQQREQQLGQMATGRMAATERATYRRDAREEAEIARIRASIEKRGYLERIDEEMGMPPEQWDLPTARAAQSRSSALADEDKFTTEKTKYIGTSLKQPIGPSGRIKEALTPGGKRYDEAFANAVAESATLRKELIDRKRQMDKLRAQNLARINSLASKLDPVAKLVLMQQTREWTKAYDTAVDLENRLSESSLLASFSDEFKQQADDDRARLDEAESARDAAHAAITDTLAAMGSSPLTTPPPASAAAPTRAPSATPSNAEAAKLDAILQLLNSPP